MTILKPTLEYIEKRFRKSDPAQLTINELIELTKDTMMSTTDSIHHLMSLKKNKCEDKDITIAEIKFVTNNQHSIQISRIDSNEHKTIIGTFYVDKIRYNDEEKRTCTDAVNVVRITHAPIL